MILNYFFIIIIIGFTSGSFINNTETNLAEIEGPPPPKQIRHLPTSSCSQLQYKIQNQILKTDYNLHRIKFQTRLKRHPKYIVTISSIKSTHDPLIELRCPLNNNKLEIYFHESRFSAENVKLFDINSIFPLHQGNINVRILLEPIVILIDTKSDLNTNLVDIYYKDKLFRSDVDSKEHRESYQVNDLESEIEEVFMKRIKPDVKNNILNLIKSETKSFFENNSVRF